MNDRAQLVEYDAMCAQIARVERVDEVKDIRDKHLAMQTYAAQALNLEAEQQCARIRIRAERRAGELLVETAERGERATPQTSRRTDLVGRTDKVLTTLPDLGISRDQSSQWQKLAKVPRDAFEAALSAPGIPSTSAIIESTKHVTPQAAVSSDALWLWGRLRDFERMGMLNAPVSVLVADMTGPMREDVRRLAPLVSDWLKLGDA